MENVFITGHRNPDMDSVCAAFAYAELKNRIDSSKNYKAVRCGHLTEAVKKHFERLGITPPPYMRDVLPKVSDVMNVCDIKLQYNEPIYELVKTYDSKHPSVYPVFDGDEFKGLLSIDDITAWFLSDNSVTNPVYEFHEENIGRVLPGKLIYKGKNPVFSAPLLVGAASIANFCDFINKDNNCLLVTGNRPEHISYAVKKQVPGIVITTSKNEPDVDFSDYRGLVFITELDTAETLRRLRMSSPVSSILKEQGASLQISDLFDDALDNLISSHLRGLSVFDGENWVGYVTRRCFLSKPRYNVILVDHNEVDQSIRGIETANVREIIDHHRLDALKTDLPIFIDAEPLGSSCTIVYQQFLRNNIVPSKEAAVVLLSGIIADTLILRSPTTTDTDRLAAGALGAICGEFDIQKFGQKMFELSARLVNSDPSKTITADFKKYKENGVRFGVGQCEVTTLADYAEYSAKFLEKLEEVRKAENLDWAMLMITDVIRERSILLTTGHKSTRKLPYSQISDGIFDMPGVMSRKKQLLAEIIHVLNM